MEDKTMIDFEILKKARNTLLDAEWAFRQEVAKALNELAEEKGTKVFSLDATIDDPRNMEGGAMNVVKAEIYGDDSVEFTTDDDEVYYIDDLDPDAVLLILSKLS